MAVRQGCGARSAPRCGLAASTLSCVQRDIRDAHGAKRRGSKKKLWEHREAIAAEAERENDAAESRPPKGRADHSAPAQPDGGKGDRKPKARKKREDNGQIDLF